MNPKDERNVYNFKRIRAGYNMIPNLIWSIISLLPISVFCYTLVNLKLFYLFLAISIVPLFLPNSFFDKIQIGNSPSIYKKLGVPVFNKFSQNGDIINGFIRKKFPEYKVVNFQRSSINRLIQQTYIFEKFHSMMFVFFCLSTGYAIIKNYMEWGIIILITNLIYNIYPNLLQQYIRLKLRTYAKRLNF